jgi:preprotein translocase subunit SecG
MSTYLSIAQIIIGVALTAVILLQTKGGGLSGVFGGSGGSIHRTRRGVERTLFIVTIVLSVVFFVVSLVNALAQTVG